MINLDPLAYVLNWTPLKSQQSQNICKIHILIDFFVYNQAQKREIIS